MSHEILDQKLSLFFTKHPLLRYAKRQLILHANDTTKSVFYIKDGYIRIYRLSEKGEELTLSILKPYDFFPLTYGMSLTPNQFYVETLTPLELWKAPQETFLEFIKNNPAIYEELTSRLLLRFDGMLSRMEHMVFSNASTKVKAILLLCAKRFASEEGAKATFRVPLTHHDIATLIGITRETTSLEMKKLETQGFISRKGKYIVVNDVSLLERSIMDYATLPQQLLYL